MAHIEQAELEELQKNLTAVDTLMYEFGAGEVQKRELQQQLIDLAKAQEEIYKTYLSAKTRQSQLVDDLKEKYGDVTIDIESGKII